MLANNDCIHSDILVHCDIVSIITVNCDIVSVITVTVISCPLKL